MDTLVIEPQTQSIAEIANALGKINPSQFFSIKDYANSKGEVASSQGQLGIDYANMIEKDIQKLRKASFSDALKEEARIAILEAMENPKERKSPYIQINKNVIQHSGSGKMFIVMRQAVQKQIKVAGEYKAVNSRPLTIAKRQVQKELGLASARYRQFEIKAGAKLEGRKLVF